MTEQAHDSEHYSYRLTVGWLINKAILEQYMTVDESDQVNSIVDALELIAERSEERGESLQVVLKKWSLLDEALEYLNKTE